MQLPATYGLICGILVYGVVRGIRYYGSALTVLI